MKKYIAMILCVTLLTAAVFSIPAQAADSLGLGISVGGDLAKDYFGSVTYWRNWVKNQETIHRPQPLMGDANIDGTVNAADALFALHFAVNGNIQTSQYLSPPKTPNYLRVTSKLNRLYGDELLQLEGDSGYMWYYCIFNSPFFADVNKDCVVNAVDALAILKYAVGKGEDFPVDDFTTKSQLFFYFPWPDEYYPGMLKDLVKETPVTPTDAG